jgi:RNA polymerase sigma-70 factor (ECF subfamily)
VNSTNETARLGEHTGVVAFARALSRDPVATESSHAVPLAGSEESRVSAESLRAAETLYREHCEFVWRNARRLGCSDDWVDDAVHEVFLVATRRLAEFEGRSSERTWLFAITFRIVQRMLRDRARQRKHIARYVQEQSPLSTDSEREAQAADYLRHLLLQLPEAQRAIVILSELEGFTSAEIAESLGAPQGSVDSRLRAARIALSRAIERERKRDERLGK